MNDHDTRVLNFLRSSWKSDNRLVPIREQIDHEQKVFESLEAPNFVQLAHSRILASTSLSRRLSERQEWDEANLWVAGAIEKSLPLNIDNLLRLNGIVTRSAGAFREQAVYADGEEYLSPESFPEALILLNGFLQEKDPVAKAALVYIFVINAHPFLNGNGRTARLAADWILMSEGYPPLCFVTSAQGHVAEDQGGRSRTLAECIGKCYAGLLNSYDILKSPQ